VSVTKAWYTPMKLAVRLGTTRCHYCDVELNFSDEPHTLTRRATIDHQTPRARGGSNHLNNLVLACSECNSHKQRRPYLDFLFETMWRKTLPCSGQPYWRSSYPSRSRKTMCDHCGDYHAAVA
jgi:hypothetical protein